MLISFGVKKKVKIIDELSQKLVENTFVHLNYTIDHRYLDGATAAKMSEELGKVFNNPESIFDESLFLPPKLK